MMTGVTYLARAERPRIDLLQIEMLYRNLGNHGADALIASGLDDLEQKLRLVDGLALRGPREDLYAALRATAVAADQVAVVGIARTARDAMLCIEDADPIAEAATLARLARLGEGVTGALSAMRGASG